ncbi:hypothetical protein CAOG_07871 [Capsaspora owczarzaki ATCC 30864]|uniref:Saposin B-type domain-containing protein n=1 Tax=Capsaspora owczarzaki (strain ATCC 30864) TaxID=595528 RepID=A0A0D2WY35_CAPO3|nr:hypothetical protein CAOG_07871 [Capsaspora owczarzaki ATCC 30864]KJE97768.1 hypothetical protein CAOG_007871 [Capsaspora owczarzaki ATCC 30864]|eukprot:XP_004342956.1 hypothetical protein CAOG_07871 [Capsaspora owczarzaki ATCC 30864]
MNKAFVAILLLGFAAFAAAAPAPKAGGSAECVLCEFVMTKVEAKLQANATAAQIEQLLDGICADIPSTLRSECNSFINTYTPTLIALLVQKLPPAQICSTLGLCSSVAKVEASVACTICEFAIRELDQKIVANGTVSEIEAEVEKVCTKLPSTIRNECDSLITLYTPEIVNAIASDIDPAVVCSLIHLCTAEKVIAVAQD